MQINKLESSYFIITIKEHKEIKNDLLLSIQRSEGKSISNDQEVISRTDWPPTHDNRPWIQMFYPLVQPYMLDIVDMMQAETWKIHSAWYQQYNKDDYHGWHNHDGCQWAAVYFVELPSDELKTRLFNQVTKEFIDLETVQEGDILIFPSYLTHKSLPNLTDKRKTIISFNCCFYDFDDIRISKIVKELDWR